MDANPHKFQSIVLGKKRDLSFPVSGQENLIVPTGYIKVLGCTLDEHIKNKRSYYKHLYHSVSTN